MLLEVKRRQRIKDPTDNLIRRRLRDVWRSMKKRCNLPHHPAYKYYGARGIKVCEEWSDFYPFCNWALTHGYKFGLQLDRIDTNGNYTPENCRFVTPLVNLSNRRMCIYYYYKNEKRPLASIAREICANESALHKFLNRKGIKPLSHIDAYLSKDFKKRSVTSDKYRKFKYKDFVGTLNQIASHCNIAYSTLKRKVAKLKIPKDSDISSLVDSLNHF